MLFKTEGENLCSHIKVIHPKDTYYTHAYILSLGMKHITHTKLGDKCHSKTENIGMCVISVLKMNQLDVTAKIIIIGMTLKCWMVEYEMLF